VALIDSEVTGSKGNRAVQHGLLLLNFTLRYAADGYARACGVGACVVTFTVGGLSVINAIAGACSENLPVVCIVGGPNSNDYGTNRILHHTIGLPDFSQEIQCFRTVTCYQVVILCLYSLN
jgi:pyruvate decarboxylase